MQKKVFIGCGAGFSGDRFDASIPIVNEFKNISEPKYLMFEVLAERTLAKVLSARTSNIKYFGSLIFLNSFTIGIEASNLSPEKPAPQPIKTFFCIVIILLNY